MCDLIRCGVGVKGVFECQDLPCCFRGVEKKIYTAARSGGTVAISWRALRLGVWWPQAGVWLDMCACDGVFGVCVWFTLESAGIRRAVACKIGIIPRYFVI
jgi:hypothetical protein